MFAAAHVWKVGWPTRFSNLRSIGSCFCNTHRLCPNRDACMFQTACTPRIFTTVINILSTFTSSSFLACHGLTSFTAAFIWPQAVLEAKVLAKALDSWRNCVNNRLRIGHTRLMHLHLLTVEDQPTCQFCSLPLTVNHILLECAYLNTIRQRFFRVSALRDLFNSIDNQIIIDFIKETHFYALV